MFRVEWTPEALNDLAGAWMLADQVTRRAITGAIQRIDERLASDPIGESGSRTEVLRILFESPLGLSFEIEEGSKSVQVVGVWFVRKRSADSDRPRTTRDRRPWSRRSSPLKENQCQSAYVS